MLSTELREDLNQFNESWQKTESGSGGLPEGFYTGAITNAICKRTNGEKARLIFAIEITINDHVDYQGDKTGVTYYLDNEKSLAIFKKLVGDVDSFIAEQSKSVADVVDFMLGKIIGASVSFERKKNGDYWNNQIFSISTKEELPDSDIPF